MVAWLAEIFLFLARLTLYFQKERISARIFMAFPHVPHPLSHCKHPGKYNIVRLVLGSDPENREMLNRIDDAIDAKGVEEVRKGLNVDKQNRHSSQ